VWAIFFWILTLRAAVAQEFVGNTFEIMPILSGLDFGLSSSIILEENAQNSRKILAPPVAVVVLTDALTIFFAGLSAYFLAKKYVLGESGETHNTPSRPSTLGLTLGFLFIVLSTAHPFVQGRAGSSGYSTVSATILIYMLKCCISASMYAGNRGDWTEALNKSNAPISSVGRIQIPGLLAPALPGALLGSYDAMSFMALAKVDPITYNVVLRLRVVFIGLLWQFIFRRRVSMQQWTALILYSIASIARELGQLEDLGRTAIWPFVLLLLQTSIGCVATVVSEKVLKDLGMPTDIVNCWLYLWGLTTLLAFQVFAHGGIFSLWKELLCGEAWLKLAHDGYMIASILMMSVFGVVTAYFLREFSSITKEMCGAVVIVLTALIEWMFRFSDASLQGVLAVVASAIATLLFATHPLQAKASEDRLPDARPEAQREVELEEVNPQLRDS